MALKNCRIGYGKKYDDNHQKLGEFKSTYNRLEVLVYFQGLKSVPDFVKNINMQYSYKPHYDPQDHVERNFCQRIYQMELWDWESGILTVISPGNNCGNGRGNNQHGKRGDLVGAQQHDLGSKKHTCYWSIEHGSDASGTPGGGIDLGATSRNLEDFPDKRAKRTTDLGNGPLDTGGIPGTDCQGA